MTEITMTVDENDQLTLNFLLIAKFFSFLFFFFIFQLIILVFSPSIPQHCLTN